MSANAGEVDFGFNNQRVINMVVPYVTNLDYLSYSSYDSMDLSAADFYATLDYIEAWLRTNKVASIPGERIWIGEYGWGGFPTDSQEPLSRAYLQRLLNYGRKAFPFLLFWEIYNNEPNKNFCLVDSNNVKVACYYLHERFINNAKFLIAQFKERNSRTPSETEFVSLISPMLNNSLPAAIRLESLRYGRLESLRYVLRTPPCTGQLLVRALAATAFIFSKPVLATVSGSCSQYLRLNNSSERTFWPPVLCKARSSSGKGAVPSPG